MKKNYRDVKDNPALSYISQMSVVEEKEEEHQADEQSTYEQEPLEPVLKEVASIEIPVTPKGYKVKPQYSEIKTRRVQLVFPPSLFRKVQRRAKRLNLSLNEFVCLILDAIVRDDPEG